MIDTLPEVQGKWKSFQFGAGESKTCGDFWNYLKENGWDGTHPNEYIALAEENSQTPIIEKFVEKYGPVGNVCWIPFFTAK